MTNKETFKVAGGTIVVSKSGDKITSYDMDCGLTETFKFDGSIREFMRDTYYTFEIAAIQIDKGEFYSDFDEATNYWCVFHTETDKAYYSFSSEQEADEMVNKLNKSEVA